MLLADDWRDGAEQGMLGILPAESLDPYGDNDLSDVRLRASGQEQDDSFAYRVQPVGDLDSDGIDDLAVSAYGTDFGGVAAGSVVLLPLPF